MSIEPGAIWGHAYNEVTTKGGRYVQGGGCMTVGVAGLILGGGFGSFSKAFGTAGASLLEAEVVTADGDVKIANACSNPDLFWALKGGGGGLRRRHPRHAAHARAARIFGRRQHDHKGVVRRGLPAPHLEDYRILRAGALQSALGRTDPGWARLHHDFYELAGAHSARGGGDVASVLRLGDGFPAGVYDRIGAEDRQRAGASFLGPRLSQASSRSLHRG